MTKDLALIIGVLHNSSFTKAKAMTIPSQLAKVTAIMNLRTTPTLYK